MSTRKTIVLILAVIALVTMSCSFTNSALTRQTIRGSGTSATENRDVSGFDQVSLSGMGDVNIVQGNEEKLTVEADDNIIPYITTEVVNGELRIGFKPNVNVIPHEAIRFDLTLKNLKNLSVSGAANVVSTALKSDTLSFSVSGAGKIDMKGLDLQSLTVNSSGAGTFTLAGSTNTQKITISGTGNYQAGDLKSNTANITVSGAGNSTLWTTNDLTVHISGLGKVDYYGKPNLSKEISGAGNVSSLGDK